MGTSRPVTAPIETAKHAALRQGLPPRLYPAGGDEPLLRELLAEAHARIRTLEAALDRVKRAV
jgi:hypothetical protein